MTNLLQTYSLVELAGMFYLALSIIKVILCLSNVSVASGVMHRRMGNHSRTFYFITAVILTTIVAFLRVPAALKEEKLRFFLVYSDRKVIRDVLSGL